MKLYKTTMGLKQKIFEHKQEFYDIFNRMPKDNLNFMTCNAEISFDSCIESHLRAWTASRINGVSASLAFYGEDVNAIKLIDKIAKEYFK
jgi:hypothetical protein